MSDIADNAVVDGAQRAYHAKCAIDGEPCIPHLGQKRRILIPNRDSRTLETYIATIKHENSQPVQAHNCTPMRGIVITQGTTGTTHVALRLELCTDRIKTSSRNSLAHSPAPFRPHHDMQVDHRVAFTEDGGDHGQKTCRSHASISHSHSLEDYLYLLRTKSDIVEGSIHKHVHTTQR
ncbi:predicted protein [Plenodomus lingam JN3]|uniref:Predicted protein n=1 Tax=Leptosphaeria maculans (strain JN3 / isolate v23.1.3 / race Av1-4-5-6-7-8) TaxID=985895 RepID=E5A5A1_LEPMJ|nr:predicted protein [Plenodomus lingam JN3]CBX98799.1 predicted protein [Plenodomus lingam JN3]